jgi:hypothetical protein
MERSEGPYQRYGPYIENLTIEAKKPHWRTKADMPEILPFGLH